ncbi:MAG: SUMF1/EgtB/PvdO family nonheme iron enzyme [Bacteroidota bacterium]
MRYLVLILSILAASTLTMCQENCDQKFRRYLNQKIHRNSDMRFSPKDLIEEYNTFENCSLSEEDRSLAEDALKHFKALDSLHCLFKETNNDEIFKYIETHIPPNNKHDLYETFNGLQRVLSGRAIFKYFAHCDTILPIINPGKSLKRKADITSETLDSLGSASSNIQTAKGDSITTTVPGSEIVRSHVEIDTTNQTSSAEVSSKSEQSTLASIEESYAFKPVNSDVTFSELLLEDSKIYLTEDSSFYLEFCFVNKGSFNLGITSSQYNESLIDAGTKAFEINIQDEVTLSEKRYVEVSEPFHISKFELSRAQYNLIVNGMAQKDDLAMSSISEKNLEILLYRLNELYPHLLFDIPTEVEWEFAAKGSSEKYYISTNDYYEVDHKIVVNDSSGIQTIYPKECLLSPTNACNMLGNVKELCKANHEYYTSEFNKDTKYIARGGSYIEDRFGARTTSRHLRSNINSEDIGLRLIIKKKK